MLRDVTHFFGVFKGNKRGYFKIVFTTLVFKL